MRRILLTTVSLALWAGTTIADDAALILGNDSYERLGRVSGGADSVQANAGLEALGFDVTSLRNGRVATTAEALDAFEAASAGAERIVVVLTGRFVTDQNRSWFLTSDAATPNYLSLGDAAVSVESLLTILGEAPANAVLVLGADAAGPTGNRFLRYGIGDLTIPQGVTVLTGDVRSASRFAREALVEPQEDLAALYGDYGLTVTGFAPDHHVVMPIRPTSVPEPQIVEPADTSAEDALWEGARALDTVEAYRNYIRRYPDGQYTQTAEGLISEIVNEPNRQARLIEEALNLNREARREIQRDLSILDYNTRGIDGIFGSGTRRAITNWQQENGFSQTSYLTEVQIARLDAQASRRAAELEAEADRRRREAEMLDRTYWEETGAVGDEPGLRAYLERYPDGVFSDLAEERLSAIEDEKRSQAAAVETAAWDRALNAGTVGAYQEYLSLYPEGQFVSDAQARISALTAEEQLAPEVEAAQAAEAALDLNNLTRRLVELRLQQMGLEPGAVDGTFDDETRRAIRRYQSNSEIEGMGYLNEPTLIRLLADAVNIISQ